ncbi:MAG: glucoamylase family protein [Gemmataceae bacterium]
MSTTSLPLLGTHALEIISDQSRPMRLVGRTPIALEDIARELADTFTIRPRAPRRGLLARARANYRELIKAHRALAGASVAGQAPSAAAEWLLDNFYIIDEVYREVLDHLPQGYYDKLPAVADGPFADLPRTYALAVGLIVHADSSIDESTLLGYVHAYQKQCPLTIGEVWAIPIMLRIGLLESLARLARHTRLAFSEHCLANEALATQQLPGNPSDSFVAGVLQAMRDRPDLGQEMLQRVETWIASLGIDVPRLLESEYQLQAANQVSIGNAVTSLRLLGALDWAQFFEQINHTEKVLRAEPTNVYTRQTFATRDSYRSAIERLARGSGINEVEVARRAIEAASQATRKHHQHLGYYLIGEGSHEFGRQLGYRPQLSNALREWVKLHPALTYFGMLGLFTLLGMGGLAWLISPPTWGTWLAILAVAALPASEIAVAMTNFIAFRLVPPRVLPRMDFRDGIPDEYATFVVIPGMLTNTGSARSLLDRIELHYLANPDAQLYFALLTDFADAHSEHMPDDEAFLQSAMEGVRRLNEQHFPGSAPRFFVLHRRRQWNDTEGCWMGWERKRGKLHEFNRLLRGATDTSYVHCSADPATLPRLKYVLTLDADTVLPKDAARTLIGTLAHPLNSPVPSADGRRIDAGYAIFQPRVSFLYKTGWRSLFARLFAFSAGIDPYSTAVSDTYMDLFGRGTFTGKGLYEIDAFEATAGRAFPENHILSHDLIESNFAGCALVSDVEVFDDFPARYTVFSRREHRWARGDWQLVPWLGPTVPTGQEGRIPNPLTLLARWKVFDNLRRSLVPPALLLMTMGWLAFPAEAWYWSGALLVVLGMPLVLQIVSLVISVPAIGIPQAWVNARAGLGSTLGQTLLGVVLLPHQAFSLLDAVLRTLWRVFISRRNLLEWEAAAVTETRLRGKIVEFLQMMRAAPAWAVLVGILLAWQAPEALPAALPLILTWLVSPLVAWAVSRPTVMARPEIAPSDLPLFRRLACKTWGFFEEFVGETDHWLPPDNYQEGPVEAVAHRTSPTNIGLYLCSTLAAHDMGYITLKHLADRVDRTFHTLGLLERYHGHFLNWYDTKTLQPLPPAYVSSVDSGNLLGCLLVLAQGLEEKRNEPMPPPVALEGLRDLLGLVREELDNVGTYTGIPADEVRTVSNLLGQTTGSVAEWKRMLASASEIAQRWRSVGGPAAIHLRAENFAEALAQWRAEAEAGTEAVALQLGELARTARRLADEMDFRFLYNPRRHLFAIGYHIPREALDQAHYDLLASEACLTSFLTVSRGEAPRRHWFQLARPSIRAAGKPGLLSWSGTMFEFLMPRLFLPVPEGTLLDMAWKAAVGRQMEYGRQKQVPWGISESAYALTDIAGNYQYQAFGVPGLGLKRGLGRDLVVSPYSTVLALSIAPREAATNVRRLVGELRAEGPYGLYEAIDYTPERVKPSTSCTLIRSYMAHHQGMILVALANALLDDIMPARLARQPAVRAVDLLLQERVPLEAPVVQSRDEEQPDVSGSANTDAVSRRLTNPSPTEPRPHLLSNGHYSVMLTTSGAGYSTRNNLDVTRWRLDLTREVCGQFIYVRDLKTEDVRSVAYQPTCREPDDYEVIYSIDKAEFRRRDGTLETLTEIAVSPEDEAEVRRVTVVNHDSQPREVELISYLEVVLMPRAADQAHPAFHKLFVETSRPEGHHALICRRRPRSAGETVYYAVHILAGEELAGPVEYETDRARFLGRRGTLAAPAALAPDGRHTGTLGAVLDPIFSIRCRVRVPAGGRKTVSFTTGVVESEEHAMFLITSFENLKGVDRAFELAWAHSGVQLKHMNLTIREAQLYQRLAGHVLFGASGLRADDEVLCSNKQGQPGLWRHGISGDLPIVLLRMFEGADSIELFRRVIKAHAYWNSHGLRTDLVVLNETPTTYLDEVANEMINLVRTSQDRDNIDRPGGVFLRKADQISPDDHVLLQAWARVILDPRRGPLEDQILVTMPTHTFPQAMKRKRPTALPRTWAPVPEGLQQFNGTGGFSATGHEYVIVPGAVSPMPWVNVIANPSFGTLVTDSGSGYVWAINSQLNRLTPWSNDPVSDPPGEVIYLRDEKTGEVWSPTPLPAGGATLVRHGAGYSVFEQHRDTLVQELTVFVPTGESLKVSKLRLTNKGTRARRLAVTYYVEWVLGTTRDQAVPHVVTQYDAEAGVMTACNSANLIMAPAVGFAGMSPAPTSWTGDRTEFLGRNHSLADPESLGRVGLSGYTGAGRDPCTALQTIIEIPPHGTVEIHLLLGIASDSASARGVVRRYREPGVVDFALKDVHQSWDRLLGTIQVKTPDESVNVLVNRWLLYQVISCRLWGRTGFFQSGGAYGFRDQLQDVMALVHTAPQLTREQILRAAARQFKEGDVQHWWHPPSGAGVRTRFSDDFLWLVLVSCTYVEATGDVALFDESVSFIESPLLEPQQEEVYTQPRTSAESATLYEHCLRALEHGWQLGSHGLPLMGIGDWNDGMNKVGAGGQGESVWLAWFQRVCMERFALVADRRGDGDRAQICRERAHHLLSATEQHAWDGRWYRRAFFDDGTPLGSASNDECQIDSLAQSWAVLAGADRARAQTAMEEAYARLVKAEEGIVLLFDPPFDRGPLQPGYIKGYVPGTRENGGQYTHGAVWTLQALARLGLGNRVGEILNMLCPTSHGRNAETVARYKGEPYVVAADVYGRPPHTGRAGWTWYTGSAGWFYQVVLGDVLGVRKVGNWLLIDPCIPASWPSFEVTYRFGCSTYVIHVENPAGVQRGVQSMTLDGTALPGGVPLTDDGGTHEVRVRLGY